MRRPDTRAGKTTLVPGNTCRCAGATLVPGNKPSNPRQTVTHVPAATPQSEIQPRKAPSQERNRERPGKAFIPRPQPPGQEPALQEPMEGPGASPARAIGRARSQRSQPVSWKGQAPALHATHATALHPSLPARPPAAPHRPPHAQCTVPPACCGNRSRLLPPARAARRRCARVSTLGCAPVTRAPKAVQRANTQRGEDSAADSFEWRAR
jgi:hypothetical protein